MSNALRRFSPLVALAVLWISLVSLAAPDADTVGEIVDGPTSSPTLSLLLPELASVSAAITTYAEPVPPDALPASIERVLAASRAVLLVTHGGER